MISNALAALHLSLRPMPVDETRRAVSSAPVEKPIISAYLLQPYHQTTNVEVYLRHLGVYPLSFSVDVDPVRSKL